MYIWKIEILFQARVLLGNSNSWGETTKAFIFSLNNTEGLAPFVSKVKKEYTGKAILKQSWNLETSILNLFLQQIQTTE